MGILDQKWSFLELGSKIKMAISRAPGHRFGPDLMLFGGFRGCRIRIWTLEGPIRPRRGLVRNLKKMGIFFSKRGLPLKN